MERKRLAAAAQQLASEGLVFGTGGNASLRAGDTALVTPTGKELAGITADDVAEVELDGTVRSGAPTSEIAIHLGAMNRHGAGAVVHTHSPAACAVGCVVEEVPVIHYAMALFGGSLRVVPYLPFGSPALADATLDALENRRAALLSNHGAVVMGDDIEHALELARLLEWSCALYRDAAAIGTPRSLSVAEQKTAREKLQERGDRI